MDQASQGRLGTTLIEVLVAFGFMGLLMLVIFFTLQTTKSAQNKQAETADLKTRALIARLHVTEILRGARLLAPTSEDGAVSRIVFQAPRFTGQGILDVDSLGKPRWGRDQELYVETDGALSHLTYVDQGGLPMARIQPLAKLGASGSMSATREPPLLVVTLLVQDEVDGPSQEVSVRSSIPQDVIPGAPFSPP